MPSVRSLRPVVGVLLIVALAVVAGCADNALRPASLEKLPPKDPPARAAPAETTPEPAASPSETETTPAVAGIQVSCATLGLDLPDAWNGQRQADGTWVVKLPGDTGGGTLQVDGSYTPGAKKKSQKELQSLVRGKDGDKVPTQVNVGGVVLGRLAVKKGNEWRLAQSFTDKGTQTATLIYSPAGNASDAKIQTTAALLQEAATKAEFADPGTCPELGG